MNKAAKRAQEDPREIIMPEDEETNEEAPMKEPKKEDTKSAVKDMTLKDLPGVGPATVEKLEASGFTDLMSVATASPGQLVDAAGINQAAATRIIAVARNSLQMGFESGDEVLARRNKVIKLTTGVKAFDTLLGGGFETGAIIECFGQFGSSKTQIAHQMAVNVQLPKEKGGCEGVAVYIDTENTFRPERIKDFAEGAGLDPKVVLSNIKVAKAYNSDHQMLLAEKVEDLIKNKGVNVKLVIVDSLTAHFRAEYIGRGTLAERQQKINRHMRTLSKLADTYNLCVYVTNQVMSRPDVFFGDPTEAIGGHIVGHNSTFRIYLRKGKKGSRVAKLIDSPSMPDGECTFMVESAGIKDI
jgi:DNA repair protein RadA